MRRNIREVMDETKLEEATLAAQRQEIERLRRVQEQQRIIREVNVNCLYFGYSSGHVLTDVIFRYNDKSHKIDKIVKCKPVFCPYFKKELLL